MTVPESKGAAHTSEPFAITLEVGSSLANETGSWRTERPVYVHNLPPCNKACPAGENIQEWLYHAEEGDYEAAWREIMVNNPLPATMGRVCYHPCETACNRGQVDEAVGPSNASLEIRPSQKAGPFPSYRKRLGKKFSLSELAPPDFPLPITCVVPDTPSPFVMQAQRLAV